MRRKGLTSIQDDRGSNDAGVNGLFGQAGSLIGPFSNEIGKLLGSLEDQIGAKVKRGLLDDLLKTKPDAAGLLTGLSSAADVRTVLDSAGLEADEQRVNSLLGELEGKDIDELIEDASSTV